MTLVRKVFKTWDENDVRQSCRLCLITDDAWLDERTLGSCVADAIVGGVTMVQLRDKDSVNFEMVKQARILAPICHIANVPLIVNDDIECAKIVGADGIHIGQRDISCSEARAVLGDDCIVGVSASNVEQALAAESNGASYVIVGPIFREYKDARISNTSSTMLKDAASSMPNESSMIGISMLKSICEAIQIPVIASGGVDLQNIPSLKGIGISGVATVSSILASSDIEAASRQMLEEVDACI